MPQLNLETFVTQYFWLIVLLTIFYIVCATIIIPKVATIFKTRERLERLAQESQGEKKELPAEVRKAEKLTLNVLSIKESVKADSEVRNYRETFIGSQNKWVQSQ